MDSVLGDLGSETIDNAELEGMTEVPKLGP